MSKQKPLLLWKAPQEPKPEPVATLTYGEQTYDIPMTLIHWVLGWVAEGSRSTSVTDLSARSNIIAAFANINAQMAADSNPMSERTIAFYKEHGIPTDPFVSRPIKDYRAES